ncbi:TonB-dependent siderophore receptor [Pseudopedobacter beijingensis]|uniref:TonB-dependent siderophore receptor n=1 Tax=Pseudopedobacter beijingensis TaxID=1207056 RepID=A0ABW4I781_9SPHI
MVKRFILFLLVTLTTQAFAQHRAILKGRVNDTNGNALPSVSIYVEEANIAGKTDENGEYILKGILPGKYNILYSLVGHSTERVSISFKHGEANINSISLKSLDKELAQVEVFGERYVAPKGLEAITRMPIKPSDQIQSISIISNVVIEEQGALTITDAVRNVPGVTLFGSYGGVKESLSSRGFRGIPVLKNGVRMDSQFQTASIATDMQGVESIQVLKGSAAITQGVITDIGNAGGVVNIVTKTPQFTNSGEVSLRAGSWGQLRPAFDVQNVLDKNRTLAVRLNGSFERADNYRPVVNSNRVYINPSLEWRPTDKTTITIEGDYMNDKRTPVNSTINLGNIDENKLYNLPHNKFLGLNTDVNNTITSSFSARLNRKLTDKLSLRAAYMTSKYNVDNTSTSLSTLTKTNVEWNKRQRTQGRNLRNDKNSTFQLDLVGENVKTGSINHTFQAGFDFRGADASTTNLGSVAIDVIDVFTDIPNSTDKKVVFAAQPEVLSAYNTYGLMAQDVVTFNRYVKAIVGLRYSEITGTKTLTGVTTPSRHAWNPSVGVMVTPISNINVFGSFTNSTSLRSAANLMSNGDEIGPSTTDQVEVGIKSDWLNNRLRFNFTYFDIITKNLSNTEYQPNSDLTTGFYFKAGDLKRKGIEAELNGRILENLQVMLGYAYLDAQYQNSPSYVNGSAPMNAPKHTANGWINYAFNDATLNGLSLGFGVYYVGERPVNEFSLSPDGHGTPTGVKPFDMPAYTTLNAQVGYKIKQYTARFYLNNIADAIGYNSYYRGGYINQIDPRNFSASVSYRF